MHGGPVPSESIERVVTSLTDRGVKAVVFDFDCTITIKHSGGRVRKDRLEAYLQDNVSPTFQSLLPALLSSPLKVGVATFADGFKAPITHVAGEALVRTHFQHYFGNRYQEEIPIVAAYPENYQTEANWCQIGLAGPMPTGKQYHLELLAKRWGLERREIALVDDDAANIEAANKEGYVGVLVVGRAGLQLQDLQEYLAHKKRRPL